MKNENKKIYLVYDWSDESIKMLSYDRTKALAKFGEDVLVGDCIDNYKLIEIDLDEVEE